MLSLNVVHEEVTMISSAIRGLLWLITKGCLILVDGFFSILDEVWRFDFFSSEYVGTMLTRAIIVASTFLGVKVMLE